MASNVTPTSSFTGYINVTASGVIVNGPDVENLEGFFLKGSPTNTAVVWFMDIGQSKTNGFPLSASDLIYIPISNLNLISFTADVANQKVYYVVA